MYVCMCEKMFVSIFHGFRSLFTEKYQVFIKIQDKNFIFLQVLNFYFSGRLSKKSTKLC